MKSEIDKNNPVLSNRVPYPNNKYPAWPPTHPPLPTHEPGHAAPTHSTSSSLSQHPITTTTTKRPTTTWPTKPVTASTPYQHWPPQVPTHSTPAAGATRPTTTRYPTHRPVEIPVDGRCGLKNGNPDSERIIGGINALPNEWPWIAVLFNGGRQFCGGSLIDSNYILTAAHCVAQ